MTCAERFDDLKPPPKPEIRAYMLRACLLEREFDAFVFERQACRVDADCELVNTWCPFGSRVAVNRQYAEEVTRKYKELAREYHKFADCMYKANTAEALGCNAGKCGFANGKELPGR